MHPSAVVIKQVQMATNKSWITCSLRHKMVAKIHETVEMSSMPIITISCDMENRIFQKANSKEEYLGLVNRSIRHVREMHCKKETVCNAPSNTDANDQGKPDPNDALQTLGRQGTENNQVMDMGDPGPNHQDIIPQPPANATSNLIEQPQMVVDNSSKIPHFQQCVAEKINKVVQLSDTPTKKSSGEMKKHVFQKAKSKRSRARQHGKSLLSVMIPTPNMRSLGFIAEP